MLWALSTFGSASGLLEACWLTRNDLGDWLVVGRTESGGSGVAVIGTVLAICARERCW